MNKQVVIIYCKKDAKYAHFMAQLISAYTDYEVGEWEEKDWLANKSSSSSSQYVIFFGDTGKEYKLGTNWIYDEFGMRYGWLGKRCICEVNPMPSKNVVAFRKHYESKAEHFKALSSQKRADGKPFMIAAIPFLLVPFAAAIPLTIVTYFVAKSVGKTTKYTDHQYRLLVNEFVLEGGLKKFMEE